MSKDDMYDLHLKVDERREFGVPNPQFKLGSSWLVQTNSRATETLGAFVSMVEISLVYAMGLVNGHWVFKGNVLPVGFHSLILTNLELVILVIEHSSPKVNILPIGFN